VERRIERSMGRQKCPAGNSVANIYACSNVGCGVAYVGCGTAYLKVQKF